MLGRGRLLPAAPGRATTSSASPPGPTDGRDKFPDAVIASFSVKVNADREAARPHAVPAGDRARGGGRGGRRGRPEHEVELRHAVLAEHPVHGALLHGPGAERGRLAREGCSARCGARSATPHPLARLPAGKLAGRGGVARDGGRAWPPPWPRSTFHLDPLRVLLAVALGGAQRARAAALDDAAPALREPQRGGSLLTTTVVFPLMMVGGASSRSRRCRPGWRASGGGRRTGGRSSGFKVDPLRRDPPGVAGARGAAPARGRGVCCWWLAAAAARASRRADEALDVRLRNALVPGPEGRRLLMRQRETLMWVFVMPIVFFYFIGTVTGGFGSGGGGAKRRSDPAPRRRANAGFLADEIARRLRAGGLRGRRAARRRRRARSGAVRARAPARDSRPLHRRACCRRAAGVVLRRDERGTRQRLRRASAWARGYTVLADLVVASERGEQPSTGASTRLAAMPRALKIDV